MKNTLLLFFALENIVLNPYVNDIYAAPLNSITLRASSVTLTVTPLNSDPNKTAVGTPSIYFLPFLASWDVYSLYIPHWSQPNLLNYSTDWDEIWCVNVFLSVDLNPI